MVGMPAGAGRRAIFAGLALAASIGASQPSASASRKAVTADFCEVARNPEAYQDASLTMTGLILGVSREGAHLLGKNCPSAPFNVGEMASDRLAVQVSKIIVEAGKASVSPKRPLIPEIAVKGRLRRVTALEGGRTVEHWALDFQDIVAVQMLPRNSYASAARP